MTVMHVRFNMPLRRRSLEGFTMTVSELLPALSHLNRADKLRVVQHLVTELAHEEVGHFADGADYPVWSPYAAFDAADALLAALDADDAPHH